MTPNLVLVTVVGVLFAAGIYLLLERTLTRVLLGVILLSNGANLMILQAGGAAGTAPLIGSTQVSEMSDPLPQAMILTAIVITLGVTAFLLAMAYRSWQLERHDEVQDDIEDRRVMTRAEREDAEEAYQAQLDEQWEDEQTDSRRTERGQVRAQ